MKSTLKMQLPQLMRVLCSVAFLGVLFSTRLETARIAPMAVVMAILISVGALLLPRARYLTLPFLLLTLALIFCYDSFSVFIKYIWLAPIVAVAAIVHIVRLRPKFRCGTTFLPLVAVAIATTLGGVGSITPEEYFVPASVMFMLGLGAFLVFLYWIFDNELTKEAIPRLCADFAAVALVCAAIVFGYRLAHPEITLYDTFVFDVQWSNNISTYMLMFAPAVYGAAKKHFLMLPAGLLVTAATVLTGSRSGAVLAPIVALSCLLWLFLTAEKGLKKYVYLFLLLGIFAGFVLVLRALLLGDFKLSLVYEDEVRTRLLPRGIEDFRSSPIFGKGLGYQGNADLYQSKQGGINWYHMFIPQVMGSLGICGILAWCWQLFARAKVAFCARRDDSFVFALCYLGLFLMTQINPGEFCPIPYAFCAVLCFVVMERAVTFSPLPS